MSSSKEKYQISCTPASSNEISSNTAAEVRSGGKINPFIFLSGFQYLLLFIGIILAIISGLTPIIATVILGLVFNTLSKFVNGGFAKNNDFLHEVLLKTSGLLILGALNLILNWVMFYIWMKLGENQAATVRKLVVRKYLNKPFAWYDSNLQLSGDFNQLNRCIEEFRGGSSEALAFLFQSISTLIASICVSFYFSWILTFVILASFPIIIIFTLVTSQLIQKHQLLENNEMAKSSQILDWILSSNELIKLSLSQPIELKKFIKSSNKSAKHFTRLNFFTAVQLAVLRILVLLIFVQAFWFGSYQVSSHKLKPGNVMICLSACLVFSETFSTLTQYFIFLSKASVSLNIILNFLEVKKNTVENKNEKALMKLSPPFIHGRISFDNVSFAYPSRKDTLVLKNVDINFAPNSFNYVVGNSGSGKSTIGLLLLKLYDIIEGNITIDNVSIENLDDDWLIKNITYVQQDSILFHNSIKENIALGSIDGVKVEDDMIRFAIDQAMLRDTIDSLPEAENTIVSLQGHSISGGQQQRVALARAIVRNTPILILDESFSALDKTTRHAALINLKKIRQNKTTIVITHHLDDVEDQDLVVVLSDGKIKEFGSKLKLLHDEKSWFSQAVIKSIEKEDEVYDNPFDDSHDIELEKHNRFSKFSLLSTSKSEDNLDLINLNINYYDVHHQARDMPLKDDEETLVATPKAAWYLRPFKKTPTYANDSEKQLEDEDFTIEDNPQKIKGITEIVSFMFHTISKVWLLVVALIIAGINGSLTALFSYFIAKVIEGIVPQGNIGTQNYNLKWSTVVFGIIMLDGITTFLKKNILGYMSELWVCGLKKKIIKNLLYQESKWFDEHSYQYSELTALLMNDTRDLRFLVSEFLSIMATMIVMLFLGLIWSIVVGWKVALVGLAIGVLFGIISILYSSVMQKTENDYKSAVAESENINYEIIDGIKTIKCLKLNDYFSSSFEASINKVQTMGNQRAMALGIGISLTTFLSFAAQMILLYFGLELIGKGEFSVGRLMSVYSLLIFTLMTVVTSIAQLSDISRGQRAGTYIMKLFKLQKSLIETRGEEKFDALVKSAKPFIEFSHLNFSYDNSEPILKDINLKIIQGEVVALFGESGSGKSTIASLLSRFYQVGDNQLFINGHDINRLEINSLRRSTAVVSQKAVFFKGTIYDNLTYGLVHNQDYRKSDVDKVLRTVGLYEFINSLPQGLKTIIGGQASNSLISGGQAQRLSIARAMLRNPSILIMDECTSALDVESSKQICKFIQDSLIDNNYAKITTILITHSQEIMNVSTRTIQLDNGRVVKD